MTRCLCCGWTDLIVVGGRAWCMRPYGFDADAPTRRPLASVACGAWFARRGGRWKTTDDGSWGRALEGARRPMWVGPPLTAAEQGR